MATENAPLSLDKSTAEKRTERPHWVLDDAVYSISALLLAVIIIHRICQHLRARDSPVTAPQEEP